jgi:hypothetical protein
VILLVQQLDIVTYLAIVNSKVMVVYEWENNLALHFHIIERKLVLDTETIEVDLET